MGRTSGQERAPQFAAAGEYELNQSSASAIPINSMYEGEEERKAAIPQPLDDDKKEEQKLEEEPIATGVTETKNDEPVMADSKEAKPSPVQTAKSS